MKQYMGIVEGFFSDPINPWSMSERNATLKFITENASRLNTYFYCPKNDPYITKKWDELYPRTEIKKLQQFIKSCKDKNITFVYGLNPFIDEQVDWNIVKEKTIQKLNQLRSVGCENICLLFDDIPLAYDVVDQSVRQSDLYTNLILFINEMYEEYKTINDFWVCLPDYNFVNDTPLTKVSKKLHANIGIIWSGNNIFSKEITVQDMQRVKRILFDEVRLIYWSNYPVNDCEQEVGMYNLGGFYPLKKEVLNELSGIVVNPMREVYANLPFYITFSEYIKSSATYSRKKVWKDSLQKLLGANSKQIISTLGNCSQRNPTDLEIKWRVSPINFEITPNSQYGQLFLESIALLFEQTKFFTQICNKIQQGNRISKRELQKIIFPTKTNVARYYPEIFSVVMKRLSLLQLDTIQQEKLEKYSELKKTFDKNFKGKNKLLLTGNQEQNFIKANNMVVELSVDYLLKFLNRNEIKTDKKMKALRLWQNINRFF